MPQPEDLEQPASTEELLAGERALRDVSADLDALELKAVRVPRADRTPLIRRLIKTHASLTPKREQIRAELSAERGALVEAASLRLPTLCRAFIYAQVLYTSATRLNDEAQRHETIESLATWRPVNMSLLNLLEVMGHVDTRTAAHIRSGRGYADMARDAIECSQIFLDKWSVVEGLQALQSASQPRHTRETLKTQQEAAFALLESERLSEQGKPLQERREHLGLTLAKLFQLIESDWDELRLAAEYAARVTKRPAAELNELASLHALARRV
jgi:hypothetical protein